MNDEALDERIALCDEQLKREISRGATLEDLRPLRHQRRRLVCAKRAQRRARYARRNAR